MKFIKFQNNILNVNQIKQFSLLNGRIICELYNDATALDFKDVEIAQKAFEKNR